MTQAHVSDAKDMAESVAAQAAEYAGTVTGEVKSLAGDVAHEVAQLVRGGLEAHDPRPKARAKHAKAKRATATRWIAWGVVLAAVAGLAVILVRRSRRGPDAESPPVTNLGPDAGTDSDIPGPAYDPPENDGGVDLLGLTV